METSPPSTSLPSSELAVLLRFLGRLFLNELDQPTMATFEGELAKSWQAMGGELPKESLEDLQADYCQLFANPKTYVAPFQSVWISGTFEGPAAKSMRHYLKETGYAERFPTDEMPDHFGLQLDIAGWMFSEATQATNNGEKSNEDNSVIERVTAEFVDAHVRWGLHMLARVESVATTDFYKSVAVVTRQIVQELP